MKQRLDLERFAAGLRELREASVLGEALGNVNPYLLHTLLPRLERRDWPLLQEIDYDAFEEDDPDTLMEYLSLRENYQYRLERINGALDALAPVCTKVRAFL